MEVFLSAAECDQGTEHLADLIRPLLDKVSPMLTGEYGGPMEHLFVALDLIPGRADDGPPSAFRLQKRVRTPRELRALGDRELFNVGSYSVRPDFLELAQVPLEDVPCYLIKLMYESTADLKGKRQLKGFDVDLFRQKFAAAISVCQKATADAGKVCRSSSDCEAACVAEDSDTAKETGTKLI
jgi:hypothetical protein